MITGCHIIISSTDADADRAFFRDVLGFHSVDAGRGWLIFRLPPGEAAVHPGDENNVHEFYFMCDDIRTQVAEFKRQKIECSDISEQPWGLLARLTLPGGGEIGVYQPRHPVAIPG